MGGKKTPRAPRGDNTTNYYYVINTTITNYTELIFTLSLQLITC